MVAQQYIVIIIFAFYISRTGLIRYNHKVESSALSDQKCTVYIVQLMKIRSVSYRCETLSEKPYH